MDRNSQLWKKGLFLVLNPQFVINARLHNVIMV